MIWLYDLFAYKLQYNGVVLKSMLLLFLREKYNHSETGGISKWQKARRHCLLLRRPSALRRYRSAKPLCSKSSMHGSDTNYADKHFKRCLVNGTASADIKNVNHRRCFQKGDDIQNAVRGLLQIKQRGRGQTAAGIGEYPKPEIHSGAVCFRTRLGYLQSVLRRRLFRSRCAKTGFQSHAERCRSKALPNHSLQNPVPFYQRHGAGGKVHSRKIPALGHPLCGGGRQRGYGYQGQ